MLLAHTRLLQAIFVSLSLLLVSSFVIGQDGAPPTPSIPPTSPAPQFLYRDTDRLVLINGYTGEQSVLPIEVGENDRFEWSPDGQHLLALFTSETQSFSCINLYHIDTGKWVSDDPIACSVNKTAFSMDGIQLIYTVSDWANNLRTDTLWLLKVTDLSREELYSTTEDEIYGTRSIGDVAWSPTEKYITFIPYQRITGGSLNFFVVMDMESRDYFMMNAEDTFYASYHPIWSKDDNWFLIMLKERYLINRMPPISNDEGDVYLVNAETGEQFRLTYTPTIFERDIHWTEDGSIAFTEVIEQNVTLTLEDAMNIKVVPDEAIIQPGEVVIEDYYDPLRGVLVSPNPDYAAWVIYKTSEEGKVIYQLNIGTLAFINQSTSISVPIPAGYEYRNILIGWRPMRASVTND
jgi:hypothetical protein